MNLTPNFTLEEMTRSMYAIRNDIDNTPSQEIVNNLTQICKLLETIRNYANMAVSVTSGYRCLELNKAIGGASNSQHVLGQAADIHIKGFTTEQAYRMIKGMVLNGEITVGQVIQEFDNWVHISTPTEDNKNEFLRATKSNGKTVYTKD
jgi:zinc D-Ala-D-Ala carboxypeptidase